MPIVRVSMAAGRSREKKLAIATEITETVARHGEVDAAHVYVVFDDVDPEDWTVGGETITQRRRKRGEL